MDHLIALRQRLHRHPELSGQENDTKERIRNFVSHYGPDQIINLGKTGIAFTFNGSKSGKTVLFRAELDALPIQEENELSYVSSVPGLAHLCGHDGHMTILAGLAEKIAANPPVTGRAILLFQPAEETGQGALEIIQSPEFKNIEPDYVFALHNIPGEALNTVIVKTGPFCATSMGMTVVLEGKTAHAAEPEKAISPAQAISKIINSIQVINEEKARNINMAIATIIHIRLGEIAFGTTPGYAEIHITLRAYKDQVMDQFRRDLENQIYTIAHSEKLRPGISYSEIFPAVVNDQQAFDLIIKASKEIGLTVKEPKNAFRWSEDFGYFSQRYKSGFFGLGSGTKQPALHHPDYDFPDEILPIGISLFYTIYKNILK